MLQLIYAIYSLPCPKEHATKFILPQRPILTYDHTKNGHQEEHPACKKWVMRCWCGYLSRVRFRLFVCMWSSWCHCHPKTSSSLASFKTRLILSFWYQLTRVVTDKEPCACVCHNFFYWPRDLHYQNFTQSNLRLFQWCEHRWRITMTTRVRSWLHDNWPVLSDSRWHGMCCAMECPTPVVSVTLVNYAIITAKAFSDSLLMQPCVLHIHCNKATKI